MVQSRLTGLDNRKLLSWYGFHEEHGLKNSSNVYRLFKTVIKVLQCVLSQKWSCKSTESLIFYWKGTRVSLDYTHRLVVCAHFERHFPPFLWTMVLQTSESVYHLNLWYTVLKKAYSKGVISITMVWYYR